MITINVDSREMFIPDEEKVLGVRRDNKSMVKVFRIPRFTLRGIDIADFTFKVLYLKLDGTDGVEYVDDVRITDSYVQVRWAVGREAVNVPGTVQVMVEGTYCDSEGNILVAWHSRYGEFNAYPAHDNLEPDGNEYQYRDLVESMKNFIRNFIITNSFKADLDITEPELHALMKEIYYGNQPGVPDLPGYDPDNPGGGDDNPGGGTDEPEEPKTLQSISVVYSGDSVTVGTSLNDLKPNITVTAHYSDGSTENITGYSLSGNISAGSNTITVSYGGKSTTFVVSGQNPPYNPPADSESYLVTKSGDNVVTKSGDNIIIKSGNSTPTTSGDTFTTKSGDYLLTKTGNNIVTK